jgi:very-long-chain (3R)-3-hydroxyacyl-CoA dehydratase
MAKNIKTYLAVYNLAALIFWAVYLFKFLADSLRLTDTALLLLNIAQGLAILEIIHVLLQWVKSPVGSTVAQVCSRLLVLVVINFFTAVCSNHILFHAGIVVVSVAWCITEVVRYAFYFFTLINRQPKMLLWMRYSFFIFLYLMGVTGEWLILLAPIVLPFKINAYTIFLVPVALSYVYYFPVLYKYMWKQRKAKLRTAA